MIQRLRLLAHPRKPLLLPRERSQRLCCAIHRRHGLASILRHARRFSLLAVCLSASCNGDESSAQQRDAQADPEPSIDAGERWDAGEAPKPDSGRGADAPDGSTEVCADAGSCADTEYLQWGAVDQTDFVVAIAFDGQGALYATSETTFGLAYPEVAPAPSEMLGFSDLTVLRVARGAKPGWTRRWGLDAFDQDRGLMGSANGFFALAQSDPANVIRAPSNFPSTVLAEFGSDGSQKRLVAWPTTAGQTPSALIRAPNGDFLSRALAAARVLVRVLREASTMRSCFVSRRP